MKKAIDNRMIEQGSQIPILPSSVILDLESRIQENGSECPSIDNKAGEVRHVSGEFLKKGSERKIAYTMKMEPGLSWRCQDIGDIRVMGYLPRKTAGCVWNQTRREKYVVANNSERIWKSEVPLTSNMEMQNSEIVLLGLGLALV